MQMTFTITLGTTPVNVIKLLKGTAFTGASVAGSRTVDPNLSELANSFILTADDANTGTIYGGNRSDIASTDYGFKLESGQQQSYSDNVPSINLGVYLVASGSGQKVHVEFRR